MHDELHGNPEKPRFDFRPALLHLLAREGSGRNATSDIHAASILYSLTTKFSSDHFLDKFRVAAKAVNGDLLWNVSEAIANDEEPSNHTFIANLAPIIEEINESDPQPHINANAIRLARSIEAWELEEYVKSAEYKMGNLMQFSESKEAWHYLEDQIGRFFQEKQARTVRNPGDYTPTPVNNEADPADDKLRVFRNFIETLDLTDL